MTAKSMGSYIPKYVQIQDYILQKIEEGVFGAGDRLPSEAELSRQFHVSRITVNTAIRDLSGKGVVERIQGKGTFVREARRADKSGSIAFFGKIGVPPMEESALKHHSLEEHAGYCRSPDSRQGGVRRDCYGDTEPEGDDKSDRS